MAALLVLNACATHAPPVSTGHGGSPTTAWTLSDFADVAERRVLLRTQAGSAGVLDTASLHAADRAARRVIEVAGGVSPQVVIVGGAQPNAFAFYQDDAPAIAINAAMVSLLANDEPAWAALIGHELAHLNLGHNKIRVERRGAADMGGDFITLVLTLAGIPFAGTIADSATTLVERSYSRDDERDADRRGVEYMQRAGYDLQGAVRLQQHLAAQDSDSVSFLSTHPRGGERVETMRRLVDELAGTPTSQSTSR